MSIIYLFFLAWVIIPLVVSLFNLIVVAITNRSNIKRNINYQPLKLLVFDTFFSIGSAILSIGTGYCLRLYADTNEILAVSFATFIAVSVILFYVFKIRDNIWYDLIHSSESAKNRTHVKLITLPTVFHFLLPVSNTRLSIYITEKGLIIDENFYDNTSILLKKYFQYLSDQFQRYTISNSLFLYSLLNQIGVMIFLIIYNWFKSNLAIETVLNNGLTKIEFTYLAGFILVTVLAVYSFFMIKSLYKWQWNVAKQNLSKEFSDNEIAQIKNELSAHQVQVSGYYNLYKKQGYVPLSSN